MYREGEDKELLEGLKKTEKSFRLIDSPGWTTFKYHAITSRNKEAGKLGIQNFKENITKVMLFCPEIRSIELNDNGKIISISRGNIIDIIFSDCKRLILYQNEGNYIIRRKYLFIDTNEYNYELTEKFNTDRNLRICCAIELDEDDKIIIDPNSPCLFCSLPLVGSESFELPFIINSPDFEPDSERQTILLDGKERNEELGKITEPGINKMILLKSQEMFKKLMKYICANDIKNRYLLLRGLKSIPNIERFFDGDWYKKNFMIPMRKILLNFRIVLIDDQYYKLTEIYLPIIQNYEELKDQKKVYSFIAKLYDGYVPSFIETKNFEKNIWEKDKDINYINIEKCVQYIEKHQNFNILNEKRNISWNSYDDFLVFIKHFHPRYLEKYAIIPNMSLDFVKLSNELSSCNEVPENMIECLSSLDIDWKKNHIHKNIINYSIGSVHDIDYAVSKIYNAVKNNFDNILKLVKYIPHDEEKNNIEKCNAIYDFCSIVWSDKVLQKRDGTKFPFELFNKIHIIIIKNIITNIEKQEKISYKYNINFIKKFLEFILQNYINCEEYSIFPNQKGDFCQLNKLYKDDNIPEEFKNCLGDHLDVDIKKELLDKSLNSLNLNISKKRIYDYKDILKKKLQKDSGLPLKKRIEAAVCLIKIIPKEGGDKNEDDDSSDNIQDKQRKLFSLYKLFTKDNCDFIEIDRHYSNEEIWKYSNKFIYRIIIKKIEKFDNVTSLSKSLNKSQKSTIELLHLFTQYTKKGKIIINQNLEFCSLEDEIYNDGSDDKDALPEKLKNISKNLGYDIRKYLVHESMERPCTKYYTYNMLCMKIDELMVEKYKDNNNFKQANFKNAAISLLEDYFDIIGEEDSKKYFPKSMSIKDNIILNVIYNKQDRKNMTEFGRTYGSDSMKILLNNPNLIKSILNGELTDLNFKSKINESFSNNNNDSNDNIDSNGSNENNDSNDSNESFIINSEGKSIKVFFNRDLSSDKKALNFYKDTFTHIINYGDDFDFENPINKRTGNSGEAYIYELLKNSGKYKNVKWKMLSENGLGELFEYNGKKYHIISDDSHYDIEVETFEKSKLYIEVKSTKGKFGKKVPFYISCKQIEMMKSIKSPDKYILAVVFNVMDNPKHFFMELIDNYI